MTSRFGVLALTLLLALASGAAAVTKRGDRKPNRLRDRKGRPPLRRGRQGHAARLRRQRPARRRRQHRLPVRRRGARPAVRRQGRRQDPRRRRRRRRRRVGAHRRRGDDVILTGSAPDGTLNSDGTPASDAIVDDGPANDILLGGGSQDRLSGGEGNDVLYGGESTGSLDIYDCGPGDDTVYVDLAEALGLNLTSIAALLRLLTSAGCEHTILIDPSIGNPRFDGLNGARHPRQGRPAARRARGSSRRSRSSPRTRR